MAKDDVAGYEYLFKEARKTFFKTLKEDLKEFLNIDVQIKDLKVQK